MVLSYLERLQFLEHPNSRFSHCDPLGRDDDDAVNWQLDTFRRRGVRFPTTRCVSGLCLSWGDRLPKNNDTASPFRH